MRHDEIEDFAWATRSFQQLHTSDNDDSASDESSRMDSNNNDRSDIGSNGDRDNDSETSSVESISDCRDMMEAPAPTRTDSNRANNQPPSQIDIHWEDGNGAVDDFEDRPPTPWGSSSSKRRIIAELKDESSNIHLYIGRYTSTNFDNIKFSTLLLKFAGNKYKLSLFRGNMKRLLVHFMNKTGPFKDEIEGGRSVVVEKWYTSSKTVSKAYELLFSLHMNPTTFRCIEEMSAEDVWKSSPLFQQYDLINFKEYLQKMSKRTETRKLLIQQEHRAFISDMISFPPKPVTSRGYPFWHTHPAYDLLEEDEMGGSTETMKPKELWKSRKEYQEFPLDVFRKHIYQLRTKRLAAPYWQYKRNRNARKHYEEELERMTTEWHHERFEKSMEDVITRWNGMSFNEND